jgi:hypothetical protein
VKYILILAAALFAAPAFADSSALAGSLSGAAANSGSFSSANPVAGAAATQGNMQNLILNSTVPAYQQINHTGTDTVKTVPQVYAPPMGVTAPCRVALSAGVSVIGVGVAAGGSVADAPCNLRELSRTYHALNETAKAVKVADGALALECLDETTAKALGNLCPKPGVQPLPTPVAVAPAAATPVAAVPAPVKVASAPVCTTETTASGIKTTSCRQ